MKMNKKEAKLEGNTALKTFLVLNKLETGEDKKKFAKRAGVKENVIYNLISGYTKQANKLTALALIKASKGKLSLKDFGYSNGNI